MPEKQDIQNNPSKTKLGLFGKVIIVILLVMNLVVSATHQILFQNLGSSRTGLTRSQISSIGQMLNNIIPISAIIPPLPRV